MSNDSGTMEANCLAGLQPPALAAAECEAAISCYDTVPPSLEAALERLYHHNHSSLCHYAVARRAQDAQAYVARRDNRPLAIFLFQRDAHSVMVFNEMMQLAAEEIERFANYIFHRFPAITRISFSKIGKNIGALSLPAQQYGTLEDIVVSLPATPEAYFPAWAPRCATTSAAS